MSNPHKPWARIDSRLQRQLGHYAHYGMPTDSSSTAIHTLIGSPSDTVPEIDYGIRHIPANDPFFLRISELSSGYFPARREGYMG